MALLAAAALYRMIDTQVAVPAVPSVSPPPDRPAAEAPPPQAPGVAVLKIDLPPPPPMPQTAPAKPAPAPRPALQPAPAAPQKPAAPTRQALRPAPDPAPPKASPPPAVKRTALVPKKTEPKAEPARRRALKPEPAPAPKPTARPAPVSKPALRPAPQPAPTPKPETRPAPAEAPARPPRQTAAVPAPAPVQPPPAPDRAAVERSGRSLLRVLEHGQGPAIEIAWPDSAGARAALYRRLVDCHGMQVALMDTGGRLFGASGAPGSPWAINMDRYSGFVRQAEGRITAAERAAAERIAVRHRLAHSAAIVRVFPRGVDASLLGGLHGLLGEGYSRSAEIRGRYRLSGGRLLVSDITADGRPVPLPVALSPARGGRCR